MEIGGNLHSSFEQASTGLAFRSENRSRKCKPLETFSICIIH
jgi:hypothetical protein